MSTMAEGVASTQPSREFFSTLITANHILHHQNVVDAYGHISARNPYNSDTFFLARASAPAVVSRREDIEEYHVHDASPINPNAQQGYIERFIHSEIYKKFPAVESVVHSHAEAVLPFGIGSTPLRPVFHSASVMGVQAPIFNIALHYRASDNKHSLLVNDEYLGAKLATGFAPSTMMSKATDLIRNMVSSTPGQPPDYPPCSTVLMRGHGFTCVGESVQQVVNRAVYTCVNARVQTTALLMQGTFNIGLLGERFAGGDKVTGPAKYEDIVYLSEKECRDAGGKTLAGVDRPWQLWCAEVAKASLYSNELADPSY